MSAGNRTATRRLAAACTGGVLALCASLYAAPAQAQTPTTFISNTGVGGSVRFSFLGTLAQSFHTGDNAAGYTLHSVAVRFIGSTSITPLMVEVRTHNAVDNTPSSTVVATLMAPSSPSTTTGSADVEFTAPPNVTLSSDTTYHLVLSHTQTGFTTRWGHALRGSLDAGTASGWSFPQGLQRSLDVGGWTTGNCCGNFKMQVRGAVIAADTTESQETTLTSTLTGIGRLTAVAAVDVLNKRFRQRVTGTGRRQSLTLAGNAVDLDGLHTDGERQLAEALRDWRNVALEDLMSSSAFELAFSEDATGRGGGDGFILWGQGDWLDFDSKPQDTFSMDGHVLSGHVGVDYQLGRLLLGLALGHSSGEVDYVNTATGGGLGTVDSELLSVYPYVHFSPDGTGEDAVWAMAGFGVGEAEVKREGQANPLKTDIEMRMFGWGLRTGVYAEGGVDLALKVDGFYAQTESDAVESLPSVDSDAVRGRLALELGHRLEQAGGALDTSLEVAARADAGDAEEGVGGEVGIGVGYTSLLGLDIEVRGRYLVAHSEEDFDEWGASVMVRYDTTRAGGQGFSFELAPGWGDANSRADSLWGDRLSGAGRPAARSLGRLDLQMGYGLVGGRVGLLTPFSELSLVGQALRRVRLGVRLDLSGGEAGADAPVRLELAGEHTAAGSRAADQRVELTATLRP